METQAQFSGELTTGTPGKVIWRFMLPIFIGNVLQQVYQMVDTIIVGQFVGTQAFAAVGSTSGIYFLLFGFIWGSTSGFTVLTAQKYGEGDFRGMRRSIGNAAVLSIIVTALLTAVTTLGMPALLRAMNTPEDLYRDTLSYIRVVSIGLFAQTLYNFMASLLRAVGNSRAPLFFLILSSIINIILDIILIIPLKLGISGAAIATVIAQGISGLLCLAYVWKRAPILHLSKKDWRLRRAIAMQELKVGIPMALQYAITAVGQIILQSAMNLLGSMAVAAYAAGSKVQVFMEQGPIALGSVMAVYCAQNMGAGNMARIRKGVRVANLQNVAYVLVVGTIVAFFGKYMTYLFVADSVPEIIGNVDVFLKTISVTCVLLGLLCIYRNGIQGMGYGPLSMIGGVIELIARAGAAVIVARYRSFFLACLGTPAAWLFAFLFFYVAYGRIMRRKEGGGMARARG